MPPDRLVHVDALPPALAALEEASTRYDAASRADATWRGYQRDWRHFTTWCTGHGLAPLPAHPGTVALYLTAAAETFKVSTLRRRLAAIAVVHAGYGHPPPTTDPAVRTRMAGIARARADEPVTRKAAAWGKDVRRMLAGLPDTPRGRQARAVLTVGFAGGFRRAELVALDQHDVSETDDGLVVVVRRSKTDQEGISRTLGIPYGPHPGSCPVRALRAWRGTLDNVAMDEQLDATRPSALFRTIRGHQVTGSRLSDRAVARIVKAGATRIGLDPEQFAAHSLRAGFVTSAADGGASEAAIMAQTGHRSTGQLRAYMRDGRLFHNNAATMTGL